MKVSVKCFALLAEYAPEGGVLSLQEGALAQDAIKALGAPDEEVNILIRNGKPITRDTELHDGDSLSLFPIVGGG